ncbi:hypothetical protein ACTXJ5_12450 [Psychrobacter alimentarius]|uniref:hypothetical protein n=1 Tax=Psychrobacter alimentarius TaxID=261164 RepID=UPI003FD1F2AB
MSENILYIVPIDRHYQATAEQVESAFSYFEEMIIEAEHEPCVWENASFSNDDNQVIVANTALTAGWISGSEEHWKLDDEEYEEGEEYYEIMQGTQLNDKAQQKLEQLFGTELELIWVRN